MSVTKLRHVNRCLTDGPLLTLAEERPPETSVYDVVAMDISRHVDDRRFAIEFLRRDAAKWAFALRWLTESGPRSVVTTHAPLLGVDKHWCYAMQLLAAGHTSSTLRYGLTMEGYGSGMDIADFSSAQVKESKHFEALTTRMVATGWRPSDVLRLLAVFPFLRNDSEKFHAFWTRRLRDKSLVDEGKPTRKEMATQRIFGALLFLIKPPLVGHSGDFSKLALEQKEQVMENILWFPQQLGNRTN
eukprot:symbB.v1.2.027688.t2/scaffold2859.1/size88004/2